MYFNTIRHKSCIKYIIKKLSMGDAKNESAFLPEIDFVSQSHNVTVIPETETEIFPETKPTWDPPATIKIESVPPPDFRPTDRVYRRAENSLPRLARRLSEVLRSTAEGEVSLQRLADELGAQKRRLYDVLHVMEAVRLVERRPRGCVRWTGDPGVASDLATQFDQIRQLRNDERKIDDAIHSIKEEILSVTSHLGHSRFAYITYKDAQAIRLPDRQYVILPVTQNSEMTLRGRSAHFVLGQPRDAFLLGPDDDAVEGVSGEGEDVDHVKAKTRVNAAERTKKWVKESEFGGGDEKEFKENKKELEDRVVESMEGCDRECGCQGNEQQRGEVGVRSVHDWTSNKSSYPTVENCQSQSFSEAERQQEASSYFDEARRHDLESLLESEALALEARALETRAH